MTDPNDFGSYFDNYSINTLVNDTTYVEVPSSSPPPRIEKTSAGYAPMERIALEGRAYRGLASGSQPWWVIITGWVMFGVPCVVVLTTTASLFSLGGKVAIVPMLGAIALCSVFLWIMYRGTKAKLAQQRAKQQRSEKYRSEMNR